LIFVSLVNIQLGFFKRKSHEEDEEEVEAENTTVVTVPSDDKSTELTGL
jgi:hypothetical protein